MHAATRTVRWTLPTMALSGAVVMTMATVSGMLIGAGHGVGVLGVIALAVLWAPVLVRWERGLYGLLAYLPFSGAVCLALYPERLALLLKDIVFVVPAYIGFLAAFASKRERLRMPTVPLALMGALAVLSVGLTFGPGVTNGFMAAIGLKVWLFYLPLYMLGFAAVRGRTDLWHLMRLLVALASVPCTIGLVQYVMALSFGYPAVMTAIYGELAVDVTQGFTTFQLGSGRLMRIPSTFTFVSQYWGFILAMLVPSYAVWRGDPLRIWRRVGAGTFMLVMTAGTLCGSRSAFVFIPLLVGLAVLLDRKVRGGVICATVLVPVVAIAVTGLGFRSLFEHVHGLMGHYAGAVVYDGFLEALTTAPLGEGTGTNTGAARYALSDPATFQTIESYYAKAALELGLPGLLLILALFGWIICSGWQVTRKARDELRPCAAVLTAFVICLAVNSLKGWQLDLDPINVYFWVFAGILCRVGTLDEAGSIHPPLRWGGGREGDSDRITAISGIGAEVRRADDPWLQG